VVIVIFIPSYGHVTRIDNPLAVSPTQPESNNFNHPGVRDQPTPKPS